jgi:hypothetical protein
MDAEARDEWHKSLEKGDIPAISEANILSTFEQLHKSKGRSLSVVLSMFLKGYRGIIKRTHPVSLARRLSLTIW